MASEEPEPSRARQQAAELEEVRRQRPWVALSTIPVVIPDKDERVKRMRPGTDLLLDLQDPPRPSYLLIPRRFAPRASWPPHPLPTIAAAADTSARLVFSVNNDKEGLYDLDYFLFDAHSRAATRLPAVPATLGVGVRLHPRRRSVGIIHNPHRLGHFLVAQLHPPSATRYESLLYYCTATREWATKPLASAPDHDAWGAHGVFAHDGLLWWVDAAYGILVCDPFLNRPVLRLVPLPEADGSQANQPVLSRSMVDKRRFVRPSHGSLRYVEIRGVPYDRAAVDGAEQSPQVWVWTLVDPEDPPCWNLDHKVTLADLWAFDSYIAAGLTPGNVPNLALLDPNNHEVVYMFEGATLFGLDVRQRRVVASGRCFLHFNDREEFQYSRFVDACTLPSSSLPSSLPSSDGGSEIVPTHLLVGSKGNIIRVNHHQNPLMYLQDAPSDVSQDAPPSANHKRELQASMRKLQLKINEERNKPARDKLLRQQEHISAMLEALTSDEDDDKHEE